MLRKPPENEVTISFFFSLTVTTPRELLLSIGSTNKVCEAHTPAVPRLWILDSTHPIAIHGQKENKNKKLNTHTL